MGMRSVTILYSAGVEVQEVPISADTAVEEV